MAEPTDSNPSFKSQYTPLMRLIAVLFILLIVQGNVWFVLFLTGQAAPHWMYQGFVGLVIAIVLAGSLHGLALVRKSFNQPSELYELDTNN